MLCDKERADKPPRIYRFTETDLQISLAWGALYSNNAEKIYYITDAGDLTTKDVFIEFQNRSGYSAELSVDLISTNAIKITYLRATSGTVFGELVVYVYDR